ncbi:MAG: YigZ family protein [Odoribacter sp.]|nr:YigZ family protein [Odoribacter sp.]
MEMEDTYKTVESSAEGIYKEKGSKFLSFIFPVSSEEQIKHILTDIKEKYFDARHHCYAYRLGADKKKFRANDDGEPSSTAGKPILGQIQSYDLTNILIIVVRYFGGTKLGVSGLIQAYRAAAIDAINNAKIIKKAEEEIFNIHFSYAVMNDVMRIIKEEEPEVLNREFQIKCNIRLAIRLSQAKKLKNRLLTVESLSISD